MRWFLFWKRGTRIENKKIELESELAAHVSMAVADRVSRGEDPAEARAAVLREMGNLPMIEETTRAQWGSACFEHLWQDTRYALRQMRRSPSYALMAILTIALGLGANIAIFLLTYTILLKELPVPNPGQLVQYNYKVDNATQSLATRLTYQQYAVLREHVENTQGVFAWWTQLIPWTHDSQTSTAIVGLTTGSIGRVLELHPYLGRMLSANAGEPGAPFEPEAMLSYNNWRIHFHADRSVLGRVIHLDGQSLTIVGVLPRNFTGIDPQWRIDILAPLSLMNVLDPKDSMIKEPGAMFLSVMGRLKPGQTMRPLEAKLQAQASIINDQVDPSHSIFNHGGLIGFFDFTVQSGSRGTSSLSSQYRQPLLLLESLCGLMLLLCTINVGLLMLSRVASRRHELAVRSALGAARHRLLTQILIEVGLIALAGLWIGLWLGWQLAHTLEATLATLGEPSLLQLQWNFPVLLFAIVLSLGVVLIAGLWPAWRAAHTQPMTDLKDAKSVQRASAMSRLILPTQIALGLVLVYAALLLTATLRDYLGQLSGYNPRHLVTAELIDPNHEGDSKLYRAHYLQFLASLRHMPGVQSVTVFSSALLRGWLISYYFSSLDAKGNTHTSSSVWDEAVTPGYFTTIGTRLLEGRSFADSDVGGDAVCVLSQSAAHYFFPHRDALGSYLGRGDASSLKSKNHSNMCRVIGIAQDAHMSSLNAPIPLTVYELDKFTKARYAPQNLAVRASSDALATQAIRNAAKQYLPEVSPRIYTFQQVIDSDLGQQRLLSGVSGGFALLALLLVATGLYGILSRQISERRREIGIRMALGAKRRAIVMQMVHQIAWRMLTGATVGVVLAYFAGHLLRSQLYGVSLHTPSVLAATLATLMMVVALAFILPAARAASIHPAEVIRDE